MTGSMASPVPAPPPAGGDLQSVVATSADSADLFGSAPALLLELQTAAGELAAAATAITGRGRRPFRPDAVWAARLGDLAYRVYLLADQTGVPLDEQVRAVADQVYRAAAHQQAQRPTDDDGWPVRGG